MKNNKSNINIVAGVDIGCSHITVSLVYFTDFKPLPTTYVRKRIDSAADSYSIIKESLY